jgi:acetyl esterase
MLKVSSSAGVRPSPLRKTEPDLEVRRLMVQLSPVGLADMAKVTVQKVRRHWQLCVKAFASRDPVTSVLQAEIDGGDHRIPVRIYRSGPNHAKRPVLVWYHGGGFVFGDLYTAGATCRALARRTGAIVIAVDYRLLPEHTFQQARDDCLVALQWAAERCEEFGGDTARIAVGGDSAGGTLAALVALDGVRTGRPIAMLQVLVYPACDLARDHSRSPDAIPTLTSAHFAWLRSRVAQTANLDDPWISPLAHCVSHELPMAVLVTAGFDPLRDEAVELGRRLVKAGVPVHLLHYPGQFHGFLCFDRVLAGAADGLDRIGAALRHAFETGGLYERTDNVSVSTLHSVRRSLLNLHPAQRMREAEVACLVLKEVIADKLDGDR